MMAPRPCPGRRQATPVARRLLGATGRSPPVRARMCALACMWFVLCARTRCASCLPPCAVLRVREHACISRLHTLGPHPAAWGVYFACQHASAA